MAQDFQTLSQNAAALKSQGQIEAAIELYTSIVTQFPNQPIARHNLAAALGDHGRWAEAEAEISQALEMGLNAPETWLVLARSQLALHKFEDAEGSFRNGLKVRPNFFVAHMELAQLIWMRTADWQMAISEVNAYLQTPGSDPSLLFVKAKILDHVQRHDDALHAIEALAKIDPNQPEILSTAVYIALRCKAYEKASQYAFEALSIAPRSAQVLMAASYAHLAKGEAKLALNLITQVLGLNPDDQGAIALQSTALRLLDDPRADQLLDYQTLVWSELISTPTGWTNLESYLSDLVKELEQINAYRSHPFGQSVRFGAQTPNLLHYSSPAISSFEAAITPVIQTYISRLGHGDDPVRRRNNGQWAIDGIWSIWLPPGGYHDNHVHPDGWISSACHIQVPECVDAGGYDGWLGFGEPGLDTQPSLGVEHFVKPQPGRLNLFPSYLWHGTRQFKDDKPRLTIAFDIRPGA